MEKTVVVLVSGETLADGKKSDIGSQRIRAWELAEALVPMIASNAKMAILHGNKPQVGFVLLRSELAAHALHPIPLDVCGADTQGATGYMLSQSLINIIRDKKLLRHVMCLFTQTLVEPKRSEQTTLTAIGPWFDREKADQYRQTRGWQIVEEPGKGYRRGVPSLRPQRILEINAIRKLVNEGDIVIAAGGGGIPVMQNAEDHFEGTEVVIETEMVACMVAQQLNANLLVVVVDREDKYILAGLMPEKKNLMTLGELDSLLVRGDITSHTVLKTLRAASEFLHGGGEQVQISSLDNLDKLLAGERGLWIGRQQPVTNLFEEYIHKA